MSANHIYRVIWSEVLETWIAVSEIACVHGKRSSRALRLALPVALLSTNVLADGTPTTVVPTGGNTSAYTSANGVPVVNTNTANAAGLSHNQYTRYDVDSKGLVLNNGNATQIQRESQLAGSVLANPNLKDQARVILNEVVSANRSTLAGFTEVVGGRADVVVANPYGITCSGCGFINTDRATLTTGTPQINGSGALTGFAVDRGDILIQGAGLNATGQQVLDLVARSIRIDGRLGTSPTGSLRLVAGANQWSYDTREVTGSLAGSGPVPAYAIDSTALGGMYAGRIRLIATEAGVGVRMLGEAAASADDFSLTSAGDVTIRTQISAQRNLTVATTGNGADIGFQDAGTQLSSKGDLSVSTKAGGGGDISNEGLLLTGGNLTVTADNSISNGPDAAMSAPLGNLDVTATTGDITNEGWLYAGTKVTARSSNGTFTNKKTGWLWSDGDMEVNADTFVNNNSIQATNDIAITTKTAFRNEIEGGMPTRTTSEAVTVADHQIRFIDAYDHTTGIPHDVCSYINVRQDTVTVTEAWAGGMPPDLGTIPQPKIAAGRNLTINLNDGAGVNTGGVLTATENLTVTGSALATFTNTAIGLYARDYNRRWSEDNRDCVFCSEYFYYKYANSEYYYNNLPDWGIGDFVSWWPIDSYSVHDFDGAKYEAARSKAYRHLDATTLVPGTKLRTAVVRGNNVTFSGGLALTNLGMEVENGVPAASPVLPADLPPTNPNGYFVPTRDPSATYLIETNPLYGLGSDYAGSDRLLKSLGIDPEGTTKRLGDANYEAYLIRQQLISATGSAVLNGYANEATQMEHLMDQAAGESKGLGLILGKALTTDQIAALKQDIVWMVETTVSGQKVLQPIVYLAAESRKSIVSGAVIAGQKVNLDVSSLTNKGGTISGAESLTVTSKGDITNTSGTLKGGDVTLTSTEGNIVNSRAVDLGANTKYQKASVEATGTLDMGAAKDITILGADVKAGSSATLTAGGDITVGTVVDKTSTASTTVGSIYQNALTNTFTTNEKNTGSTITTGGNLTLDSGGDTTLTATKATVGGDLNVTTGGDFKVLSAQDKTTTHSDAATSGGGVGGGLWGSEKTMIDDFTGTNVKSSITVGGRGDITVGKEGNRKDMTVQGSDLAIAGGGTITAKSVSLLEGHDEKHTVTTTRSTTFLSTGGEKERHKGATASAESGRGAAEASASAGAGASENHEFNLTESRTTTVDYTKSTGVASNLKTGGDLTINADDAVTVKGSNVDAGRDLAINASNIEVLAGENTEKTTTTTRSTKIGIYTDSKADAKAEAEASATGMSASSKTSASVEAGASSTVTVGARIETGKEETTSLTHTSSSLKSGRDMTLTATEEARFVGAKVESGNDLTINAKDITSLAAQDETKTTRESMTRTTGIYLEGEGSAELKGSLKAGVGNASASGGGGISGEAGAGLRYSQEEQKSGEGSTRNVVSTFKAGGNITRTATDTITDQGTQLDAAKDITQSATTLREIAAEDKTWSYESSEKHDAKLGVYAGGSYQGDAGAQMSVLGAGHYGEDLGPEASAGFKAKYTYDKTAESRTETTAVTSRYKAGGSISSTTTDKTTLIGTQFEAGKDVSITAGSLDYQAAHDTASSSSETKSGSAEAKLKVYGTTGVDLNAGYEQEKSSSTASTARVGNIVAGGNVTVTAKKGDVRLEGTGIDAAEKATIKSETGNVTFDAAKSTSHEESSGFNVSAGFGSTSTLPKGAKKGTKPEKENKTTLGGGYSNSKGDSATEQGVGIKARNVEVFAEKDVTMRGAQVDAKDAASVTAKTGDVKLLETVNSESSSSFGISGKATGMRLTKPEGDKSSAQYGGANLNASSDERKTGTATSIKSGGDLTVKGRSITSQEAQLNAGGTRKIEGNVQNQSLTRVDTGMKVDVSIDGSRKTKPAAKPEKTPAADNKPATTSAGNKAKPPKKNKVIKNKPAGTVAKKPPAVAGPSGSSGR
jgi:filamentous hemagglutinin